jgi:hypothetical protein
MRVNYDYMKELYALNGHEFLTRPYECNPFGFRASSPVADQFGCVLGIAYVDGMGEGQCLTFKGSTLPGLYYLKNKLGNVKGTFIVQPGQHKHCWELSFHHINDPVKKYEAFRQIGIIKGWRDNNSDGKADFSGATYTDGAGVNGHHAADKSAVGGYSAGCQVVQDKEEHLIWIAPARRHKELYENKFHYTLFQV